MVAAVVGGPSEKTEQQAVAKLTPPDPGPDKFYGFLEGKGKVVGDVISPVLSWRDLPKAGRKIRASKRAKQRLPFAPVKPKPVLLLPLHPSSHRE
jgi:hypothetical protein